MSKRSSKRLYAASLVLTSLISATVVTAFAEDATPGGSPPTLAVRKTPRTVPTTPAQPTNQQLYLIRTTLLILDTANRTGNYSVLRDSASPRFQQSHTAADLAVAFQKARSSVDLGSVAIRNPQLLRPPQVTATNQLHLVGTVPTETTSIAFEMLFDQVGGHWRLGALAVSPVQQRQPQRQAANSSRP